MSGEYIRVTHNLVSAYSKKCMYWYIPRISQDDLASNQTRYTRAFHTDECVNFLNRVTPETAEKLTHGGLLLVVGDRELQYSTVFEDCSADPSPWVAYCRSPAAHQRRDRHGDKLGWAGGLHHATHRFSDAPDALKSFASSASACSSTFRHDDAGSRAVRMTTAGESADILGGYATRAVSGAILLSDPPAKLAFDPSHAFDSSLNPPPPSIENAALICASDVLPDGGRPSAHDPGLDWPVDDARRDATSSHRLAMDHLSEPLDAVDGCLQ
ncbi:hypothetical protein C8F01DRAFT_575523 [Mycena amicta]|nr:hypothetical protein C8F01DRAFT_575523 [Mycena amicta]